MLSEQDPPTSRMIEVPAPTFWPFVTAYGLKAAALAGNDAVADAAYDTHAGRARLKAEGKKPRIARRPSAAPVRVR